MRRIFYGAVATAMVASGAASVAHAKQVVPMNTQDVDKSVTQAYGSLAVSGDYGNITLRTGRTTSVHAHEEWNLRQPTLDVSISRGVLHVTINCNGDVSVGNVVTVGGALDQANDCIDTLTVTTPATVPVQADTVTGSISSVRSRGGLKLSTGSGDITINDAGGPQVDATTGNGTVAAVGVTASSVSLSSDSGDVRATTIHAHSLTVKSGNGAVTCKVIKTTVLTADSDSGDVTVTDATVTAQADAHSGNGAVHLTGVQGGSLTAATDAGDVDVSTVSGTSMSLGSGNGAITAAGIRGHRLTVQDSSGDVHLSDTQLRDLQVTIGQGGVTARELRALTASLHSDSGTVAASLTAKPQTLTATSGNGDVNLDVPTGRYDVEADSGNGAVHVGGLIIDTSVRPFIRAHSDAGNVTVTGH